MNLVLIDKILRKFGFCLVFCFEDDEKVLGNWSKEIPISIEIWRKAEEDK